MKTLFILLCFLGSLTQLHAYDKKAILSEILKAYDTINYFEIGFISHFKFKDYDDTNKSIVHTKAVVKNRSIVYLVSELSSKFGTDSMSYTGRYFTKLYKGKMYYRYDFFKRSQKSRLTSLMNDCFPDDFGIKKKELSLFDIKTLDSNYIFLEQNRSWDDKMLNSKVEIKKCLRFDRKKGLFDLVEAWAWFDGGVQYSRSEISYLNRKSKAFKSIVRSESRTRDALLRSRINGDSLSQVNQSKIVLLKVGDTMPEFGARVFSSNDSITLRRADTGIVVFDFFYTTCGPCIAAIREINRLDSAFRPKGVRVYGVDPFVSDWKKLEKFMLQHPMNYSVLQTPYETSKLFGVRGYPSLFVVKNGIVIYVTVGYSPNLFTELSKIIESSK